jgi:hypothetical protein
VFRWLALTSILLGFANVASGAMLCRDASCQVRVEFDCDHGHSVPGQQVEQNHPTLDSCWCASCACDHTVVGISFPLPRRGSETQIYAFDSAVALPIQSPFITIPRADDRSRTGQDWPSRCASDLQFMQTIILIV